MKDRNEKPSSLPNTPFGPDADVPLPPELRKYLEDLYDDAWVAYAEVDYPLGTTDDAMLIWFTFDVTVTKN